MTKLLNLKILAPALFILLIINACAKPTEPAEPAGPAGPAGPAKSAGPAGPAKSAGPAGISGPGGGGPVGLSGPNHSMFSGRLLFQTDQTPAELFVLKNRFLQATPIIQAARGVERYNVNSVRGPSFQPISPIVHTYHGVGALVPLAVALPESFRWNIPQDIRDQVSQYDVDILDILFTPQEEIRDADDSLKAAYWMFPNRPPLDNIRGAPSEYQKTILLGLFDSDHPVDAQVVTGQLRPFGVSLHDERVSPDTGHINTRAASPGSFSFYSLAIFQEQRRAAVTLHWMLTIEDRQALTALLRVTQTSGAVNHFEALIQNLNQPISPFYGTPMMRKLLDLVNP